MRETSFQYTDAVERTIENVGGCFVRRPMVHFITVVGSRLDLLPHTLSHYGSMGIDSLLVSVHLETYDSPLYSEIAAICKAHHAVIVGVYAGPWLQEVNPFLYRQALRQYPDDWFVVADVDEFHVYPEGVCEFLKRIEDSGYDYVQGCLVDRLAKNGELITVRPDVTIWQQFPLAGMVTYPILKANILKIVAAKGYVRLAPGQHTASNGNGCPTQQAYIPVHHFKWSSDVIPGLRDRVQLYQRHEEDIWRESERFIHYLKQHEGKVCIDDPELMIAAAERQYPHWNVLSRRAQDYAQLLERLKGLQPQ
jgi:hypothetical protein